MKIFYQWLLFIAIIVTASGSVQARSLGISGQSQAGCGGVGCHAVNANAATTVSMPGVTGTITMAAGSQRAFVAAVAHAVQPNAGINISIKNAGGANVGEFTAGTGLQLLNGELTHTMPQPLIGTPRQATFQFVWTAPAAAGTYTLRAAGNAVNSNGLADPNDSWNIMPAITIIVPGVQVTSPNGNEQWCRGTSRNITWTSSGIANVDIAVSADGGDNWLTLASNIPATPASWSWAIPATQEVAGTYRIRVSDRTNVATNDISNANFYILSTPAVTQNPVSTSVCVGQPFSFTIATDNPSVYTYQWRRNSENLTGNGANTPTYSIATATAAHSGVYSCTVTGCNTGVSSDTASLVVNLPPSITTQPRDTTVCPGSSAILKSLASGEGLSYQWRRNGVPVGAGITATYTIPNVTEADTGAYDVVVTGLCSPPATSTVGRLKFPSAPQFFTQPTDTFVCSGTELKMKVEVSGTGLTYIWKRNGIVIANATTNNYTIPAVSAADTGLISIEATNSCGFKSTVSARIRLGVAPTIVTQPRDSSTVPGSPVVFRVTASGTALTYQWQKNGNNLTNETSATLTITSVKPSDSGVYTCIVKNSCGQVTSTQAKLTVNGSSAPSIAFNTLVVEFGCVLPGATKDSTLTGVIENIGGSPLIVTSVSIGGSGASSFSIVSGGGGFTLAPNAKRTVTIRFAPTVPGGALAVLNVASNSSNSPTPTALIGQGCLSSINVSKVVFDTTTPGIFRDSIITVCNNTTAAFAVTGATVIGGDDQFEIIASDAMPKTLQPNGCMTFTIRYKPKSMNGATAILSILAGTTAGTEEHQVHLEGKSKTTGVDEDDAFGKIFSNVRAFPNPSTENVSFEISSTVPALASLTIVDAEGRLAYRKTTIQLNEGTNYLQWNGASLLGNRVASGTYTAILSIGKGVRSTQFMIIR